MQSLTCTIYTTVMHVCMCSHTHCLLIHSGMLICDVVQIYLLPLGYPPIVLNDENVSVDNTAFFGAITLYDYFGNFCCKFTKYGPAAQPMA